MAQNYKIKNMLENLPFYKINKIKKNIQKFTDAKILSELSFFPKTPKELTNFQLSKELPLFPKRSKRPKKLTKHQILKNILLFYDSVGISK